jgi:hypothetical protein
MKPKLVSDVLRQLSPRKYLANNRYTALSRDSSPADSVRSDFSQRSRTQSFKRKIDASGEMYLGPSYASAAGGGIHILPGDGINESNLEVEIAKVKSVGEKISTDAKNSDLSPGLISLFCLLSDAISGICSVQSKLASRPSWKPAVGQHTGNNTAHAKKPRHDAPANNMVDLATLKSNPSLASGNNTPTEDPKVKKFKEVVKESERSTLIFKLNLGSVPIMNQDTMSTRATMALTELAAKAEKCTGKTPSNETIATLNDVLSVAKGIRFFGKKTKSFKDNRDPNSGAYCTLPVRYDFQDKASRVEAETVLRDKCKIQCSTPYPAILRESIRQVWDAVKVDYPEHYIRVKVDTEGMCLKVDKRPIVENVSGGKKIWSHVGSVAIPTEALDVTSRDVPEGFKVRNIPRLNKRVSSSMELDCTDSGPGSGSGSGSGSSTQPNVTNVGGSPPPLQ